VTTLSSSCAAGHTWLLAEDEQSQSLLQVKREREAPQSDCTFELYRITGPSLKSAPEMLEEFAGIDTGSEALTNRQPSLASFK
jgi:hypothetical protein